jgi:hypothetical protein
MLFEYDFSLTDLFINDYSDEELFEFEEISRENFAYFIHEGK